MPLNGDKIRFDGFDLEIVGPTVNKSQVQTEKLLVRANSRSIPFSLSDKEPTCYLTVANVFLTQPPRLETIRPQPWKSLLP